MFLIGVCQELKNPTFQQAVFAVSVCVALVGANIVSPQPIEFVADDPGL